MVSMMMLFVNYNVNVAIEDNVPSIADGGTTKKLTSKYK